MAGQDSIDRRPSSARHAALPEMRRRFYRAGKWEIPRLFVGERGPTAAVQRRDMQGRERIRMAVDSTGLAQLVFLDASGRVISSFPR
jgi:hypothetical protein